MDDKRHLASYIFSASLFCLAAALIYFTFVISQIGSQLPVIFEGIEKASLKAKPVIEEVYKIRELIPAIINEITEIRKQIPKILHEVKQTRELVPSILKEVKKTREMTPSILKEVKQMRESLPAILKEVKKTREAIPAILKEVKKTREAIPQMLDKGGDMLKDAKTIVKEASEDAVTGILAGIIKAPFKLVGGLFGAFKLNIDGLNNKDHELAFKAVNDALSADKVGKAYSWLNPDSGNKGIITIKARKVINDRDCRLIVLVVNIVDKKLVNKDVTVCLTEEGQWEEALINNE